MKLAPDRDVDRAFLAETAAGKALGLIAIHIAPLLFYPQPLAGSTTLVVAEEARRPGVGRRFVEFAHDLAKEAGRATVEMTTALGGRTPVPSMPRWASIGPRSASTDM